REPRRTGRVLPVRPAVEGSLGGYAARAAVVPEFDRRPDGPAIRRGTVSVAARSDSGYGCCQFRSVLLRAAPRLQSAERSRPQQRAVHLREPSRKPDGCGTPLTLLPAAARRPTGARTAPSGSSTSATTPVWSPCAAMTPVRTPTGTTFLTRSTGRSALR